MIDPRGLTVHRWCDLTAQNLAQYGNVPVLLSDGDWRLWAETVINIPQVAQLCPPDPRLFPDWGEWAARFVEVVQF